MRVLRLSYYWLDRDNTSWCQWLNRLYIRLYGGLDRDDNTWCQWLNRLYDRLTGRSYFRSAAEVVYDSLGPAVLAELVGE